MCKVLYRLSAGNVMDMVTALTEFQIDNKPANNYEL